MTQPPEDQLKALWQGQDAEIEAMSVDAIRRRAIRYTTRRRRAFLFALALLAAEVVMFGYFALIMPTQGTRIGMLAILVGLGWTIARFSLTWPGRLPNAAASGAAILEFHRGELQRMPTSFSAAAVMFGPMIVGILIFLAAAITGATHGKLANAAPILALVVVWLGAASWLQRSADRKRRRLLEEVDATRVE
jgi:hypothetical protein